jgi:hypothetical protein
VLTGCLRAAKESIFTGLNNFKTRSVLDIQEDFSSAIGFTEEEVNQVLDYYNLSDYKDMVKENYNGYNFGRTRMYCPWDVMNFCCDFYNETQQENPQISANNYWINSSGNNIINEFMDFIDSSAIDKMQDLLDGKSIVTTIQDCLCYGDLDNHSEDDFWTLLLYTGYLTINPNYRSNNDDEYEVRIPNLEIRKCFKERILDYSKNNPTIVNYTTNLTKALFSGNTEEVQDNINNLLEKYVSIRDFATKAPPENYYHGFLNGILANSKTSITELNSNYESGNGYVDLLVKSKINKSVAVIELKQTDKEEQIDALTLSALNQIKRQKYAEKYVKQSIVKTVYIYGICFYKKECSVLVEQLK